MKYCSVQSVLLQICSVEERRLNWNIWQFQWRYALSCGTVDTFITKITITKCHRALLKPLSTSQASSSPRTCFSIYFGLTLTVLPLHFFLSSFPFKTFPVRFSLSARLSGSMPVGANLASYRMSSVTSLQCLEFRKHIQWVSRAARKAKAELKFLRGEGLFDCITPKFHLGPTSICCSNTLRQRPSTRVQQLHRA